MRTVVIHSGGLDSTVLLWEMLAAGDEVLPLSFDYGQRHACELEAAQEVRALAAATYGAHLHPARTVPLPLADLFAGSGCSQLGDVEVPEGHYADESMRVTVVPNRNMIMLAIAAGYAIAHKAQRVAYAAHAGDHTVYPDCRPIFVSTMSRAFALCDWQGVDLHAPYITQTKTHIVSRGVALNAPMAETWSCYKGSGLLHCGKCGTCVERREAFAQAGVDDTTGYEVAA